MATRNTVLAEKIPIEHVEQREYVSWFRKRYRPKRIFAIPNGGKRGKREAHKLVVEGVSAGVPDLFVPEDLLWVEMKRKKGGSLSKEQKDWRDYLLSIGHKWIVAKGFEDAKTQTVAILG